MRLDDWRQSQNIEDRRGERGTSRGGVSFGGGRKIGVGTVVLALAAWYFLGVDPMTLLSGDFSPTATSVSTSRSSDGTQPSDAEGVFIAKVLSTTETVWGRIFQQQGWGQYPQPTLVLYTGATHSACGTGRAQMGPFYCPADQKVYLDLSFFRETGQRLGVKGDFSQGYVLAHEVGHHVQQLLGLLDQYQRAKQARPEQANKISIQSELQADCFAGLWAHELAKQGNVIEQGDIEEAIESAQAVGDDHIQRSTQGYVVPDSFTHGSSAQRVASFTRGFKTGDIYQCGLKR
ncbi:KPN_02809 family neutral zinc metallopeptidase [Pelistega europaea]|uniref:Neutral zinc metallopeptidase n=1 Tax=Pelistega europaea TaxID=106147 RepID=A0A7Y4LA58_9BURK|nr:neutral zinc metallopeptidase [Pelistega europaea]NOL48667.1 hypothetical protein [Pelistega europaea]